jgi:hypothetical protein
MATPTMYDVVSALETLGRCATRTEIARQLDVSADDVGEEASTTAGPLGEAISEEYVVADSRDKGYWCLTEAGQTYLDAGLFR